MAGLAKHQANDITFDKDDTITLYMSEFIYNGLENIGKKYYKDKRSVEGMIKTYAIVKIHHIVAMTSDLTPIHCELFRGISKRNYTNYLTILQKEIMLQIEQQAIEPYKNKSGKHCIKQEPNKYRVLEFGYDILGNQNKIYPVKLLLTQENYDALKIKYEYIRKHYKDGCFEKRISTMLYNNNELLVVKELVGCIKKLSKSQNKTNMNRIYNTILKLYDNSYLELVKEVLERLDNKEEHIVGNNLNYIVDNKHDTRFDYYSELRFNIAALDECMCLKDLRDLATINKIPQYGKDDKLYSIFSRIRRPIRKHITFRGSPLVEVSDIRCAHFTMLPKIFEDAGIEITPWWELESWMYLTQQGDLYSEVVDGTNIPRDAIKPTFQSFFSIKNENAYIYGGKEKDCSNRLILCRWFKRNYPNILKALLDWHNNQPFKIKRAANRVESKIMNSICDELRVLGLHPFRLHDAIYLPQNEVDKVTFNINERVHNYINRRNPMHSRCA